MTIEVIGCKFPEVEAEGSVSSVAVTPMTSLHSRLIMDRSKIEKISKALADKTRLRIFEAISATNHMNCGEIVSLRGVSRATVSHHLKILNEAGLIACRREGQFVYSQAVPATLAAYTRALGRIACGKQAARRR
jgi:ArsR family transcriptional regulator, arsenate/arsenite/antimonite-responsive transcriptional repressor